MIDKLIPDWAINKSLAYVFSKPSLLVHTVWFVYWFGARLDISLLTNIVSLEAIYIGLLIGIQQLHHHKAMKKHIATQNKKK